MDGRFLVAYGLEKGRGYDLPLIPDILVLRQRKRFWRLTRSEEIDVGSIWYAHTLETGLFTEFGPFPWEPGSWVMVEPDGFQLFPITDEDRVKREKAEALIKEANLTTGQPERILSSLRAAGALMGVPVDRLVRKLEAERKPGEGMAEAYLRLRRSGKT